MLYTQNAYVESSFICKWLPDPAYLFGFVFEDGAFQVALIVKNLPANAREVRDLGLIPGSGRCPGEGNGNPFQCSCLENPMDQRSLADYRPQGRKELDMTEETHHAHIYYFFSCKTL